MSAAAPSTEALVAQFSAAGLDAKSAADAAKTKFARLFSELLVEAKVASGDKATTNLLYTLASKYPAGTRPEVRTAIVQGVANKALKNTAQVDAAIKFAKKPEQSASASTPFSQADFDKAAGVGVVVSKETVDATVAALLEKEKANLLAERYRAAPKLLGTLNSDPALTWADGQIVKASYDAAILALLGPKTEEDAKKVKPAKPAAAAVAADKPVAAASSGESADDKAAEIDWLEMLNGRDLPEARNSAEILADHKRITAGKPVITRFPPEPNGYLHIGHAKSMNFNFGLAKKFGGDCIMRFDDTNPEAEKGEYIDNILENLEWLGHKPSQITYSSDYFQELYDLAVKLIRKGKAYVDHQTAAEIKLSRETKIGSPWRDRPVEESVRLFEDMRKGKFEEGKATLRMKGDMNASNPQMWDLVAYRIKYCEHPHVGNKWCIYPSYDYTHCIVDSLEHISHSICTLEFEVRRESYYWLLHELDLYKPNVWEFSRLQLEYTVMSKRRLLKLVTDKYVSGWDDPRLPTLNGFRRRGYPAEALHKFCETIGISRNENFIALALLEHVCRQTLEPLATRAMVVVDPVKVILTDVAADFREELQAPNYPKDASKGTHGVTFTREVYIERSDVSATDAGKDFFGLSPGKEVHLKYAYNIKATKVLTDSEGRVTEVHATVDRANTNKPKGKITWVSAAAAIDVELRLYDILFKSADPMGLGSEEWLGDLNPNSLIVTKAKADPSLKVAKPGDYYQFERQAFFVCDRIDSTADKLVFNRTVNLKESKAAPAAAASAPAAKKQPAPKK